MRRHEVEEGAIEPGWYRLNLPADGHEPDKCSLYVDAGDGFWESDRIPLTHLSSSGTRRVSGVVLVAHRASRIEARCASTASAVDARPYMRRVGKLPAALFMLTRVLRTFRYSDIGDCRRAIGRGPKDFGDWLYRRQLAGPAEACLRPYAEWVSLYDDWPVLFGGAVAKFADKRVRFSILLPVYNPVIRLLEECLHSVTAQTYGNWELCIADDASTDPGVREFLRQYAAGDSRVRVIERPCNGHIAAASNTALSLANGDFSVLLDQDDTLHPEALHEIASAVAAHPQWRLVYTDEDKIDEHGARYDPYFKPDFNLDLLRGQNCISHLGAYDTKLIRELGGFRPGYEGSQDWDLALRVHDHVGADCIGHVPRVLYHWRSLASSTASSAAAKPYAADAALRSISDHLSRCGSMASAERILRQPGNYRVRHPLPTEGVKVSILIPTRDQPVMLKRCLLSLMRTTSHHDVEILIADNGSVLAETRQLFMELERDGRATILSNPGPFNFSALNNRLATSACGEVLLLLNDDVEAIRSDWLDEMIAHALRPEVGAVGAKLYYPNGKIQHAGVVVGGERIAANAYRGMPGDTAGHGNRALLAQNFSAVTAACMAVRKRTFEDAGGFDESLPVAYNDVDFCLRLRQRGLLVVWTPFAELLHHESISRARQATEAERVRTAQEDSLLRSRWKEWIVADPAYNINLELTAADGRLAFPPRRQLSVHT